MYNIVIQKDICLFKQIVILKQTFNVLMIVEKLMILIMYGVMTYHNKENVEMNQNVTIMKQLKNIKLKKKIYV